MIDVFPLDQRPGLTVRHCLLSCVAQLLKLSPASSFAGGPLTRPPFTSGSTPGTTVASTATHAVAYSGRTRAPTPLGAAPSRSRRHGRGDGALLAGGSDDVKKEVR